MQRSLIRPVASLILLTGILASPAWSHYLWVTIDNKSGDHGSTNVYFEGGPGPGDGQYLDPFVERGTTWIRTLDSDRPAELKMEVAKAPNKRWLSTALPEDGPRAVDSYGKWGVYRYGKTDVLLHYYAKHFDVSSADELKKLARAEHLDLDIVPVKTGDTNEFQILWKGKPVAGRPVAVRGPGIKPSLTTDEDGHIQFKAEKAGRYTLRTSVEEQEGGKDDGKEYQKIRHNITAVINLPIGE